MLVASRATRERVTIGDDDFEKLCRAFLVLVDTVPLYTAAQDAQAASDAALLAARMLQKRELWTVTLKDEWLMKRAELVGSGTASYMFGG